jgi:hypothetical protein
MGLLRRICQCVASRSLDIMGKSSRVREADEPSVSATSTTVCGLLKNGQPEQVGR